VALGLALVLGQVSGYAHALTHLGESGKIAHHDKTCPFCGAYAQIASGLAHSVPPSLICAEADNVPPSAPQLTVRSALILLPFARAPPL
jgi:Protein of unknown function (DUF2946)